VYRFLWSKKIGKDTGSALRFKIFEQLCVMEERDTLETMVGVTQLSQTIPDLMAGRAKP
jgi:hypothetical protein